MTSEADRPASGRPGPPDLSEQSTDDTAAFQRFYRAQGETRPTHGFLYRLLVGWWRDR